MSTTAAASEPRRPMRAMLFKAAFESESSTQDRGVRLTAFRRKSKIAHSSADADDVRCDSRHPCDRFPEGMKKAAEELDDVVDPSV